MEFGELIAKVEGSGFRGEGFRDEGPRCHHGFPSHPRAGPGTEAGRSEG